MKKTVLSSLVLAALLSTTACGKKKDESKEVAKEQNEQKFDDTNIEEDTKWAVDVADAGMYEVKLAELAVDKATTSEVKDFARTMVTDHSIANAELKAWAAKKNVTLPTTITEGKQEKYNKLAEKTGMDFDKEFMDMMVKDHKDDVDKFEKQAEDGKDADLKKWASDKLPTLRHHLEMAETTQEKVKDMKKDAKKK